MNKALLTMWHVDYDDIIGGKVNVDCDDDHDDDYD